MPYGSLTARSFVLASVFGSSKRSGAPATCYFALLYSANPATVIGTEPVIGTGGYDRVGITNDDALWTITNELATNDVEIRWPLLSATWTEATVSQWAIYDAATAGTCWAFGALTTSLATSVAGRQPVIPAGFLDLTQAA